MSNKLDTAMEELEVTATETVECIETLHAQNVRLKSHMVSMRSALAACHDVLLMDSKHEQGLARLGAEAMLLITECWKPEEKQDV